MANQNDPNQKRVPPWKTPSPFLSDLQTFDAYHLLMADREFRAQAADEWATISEADKDFIRTKLQLAQVEGLDAVRRRLDHQIGMLEQIRVSTRLTVDATRLTVDALKGGARRPAPQPQTEAPQEAPQNGGSVGGVIYDESDPFAALDASPSGVAVPSLDGTPTAEGELLDQGGAPV